MEPNENEVVIVFKKVEKNGVPGTSVEVLGLTEEDVEQFENGTLEEDYKMIALAIAYIRCATALSKQRR